MEQIDLDTFEFGNIGLSRQEPLIFFCLIDGYYIGKELENYSQYYSLQKE